MQTLFNTPQQLEKYSNPLRLVSPDLDKDFPFSFKDWYATYSNVIPDQAYKQYNQYLITWYQNKNQTETNSLNLIRIKYLNLLNGLQMFLTDIEKETWYSNVNLSDEKELLLEIPFFATKLKNISLYYLQQRKKLKETKLKYNLVGSVRGGIQELTDVILSNYSKRSNTYITVPASVWTNLPELSAINDTINIEIEELYDDHQYFDRSLEIPLSSYINNQDITTETYFNSLGLSLTSLDWAYSAGTFDLSALNLSAIDLINDQGKYLGESKYTINVQASSISNDYYAVNIVEGNNFFYYPFGVYESLAYSYPIYKSLPLSSANIETLGIGGSSIDLADTIFVKSVDGINGAWLNYKQYDISNDLSINAFFGANSKTIFRYPFAGYGLSGDSLEWTGPSLTYDPTFTYLDNRYKKAIEEIYWSSIYSVSSTLPININNTTLVDYGAYANSLYTHANKIRTWDIAPDISQSSYNGDISEAWLYKITKTNLSILSGDSTTIKWPYTKLDDNIITYIDAFPDVSTTNICNSMPLSALYIPYATASNHISSADIIYKVPNYQSTQSNALECAWLSGSDITKNNFKSISQKGFTANFKSGTKTRFVWTGNDTLVNTIFISTKHENNCLYLNNLNANNNALCTCRQVQFTPFGHNGMNYTDFGSVADFIALDTFSPLEFDLNTWVGSDLLGYNNSSDFTWFNSTLSTPNWGYGSWSNNMLLKKGSAYIYYRTTTSTQDLTLSAFPDYTVRHAYTSNNTIWIKGFHDVANDIWYNGNKPSDMIFNANDVLLYQKTPISSFILSGFINGDNDVSKNINTIWSTYDHVVIDQPNIGSIYVNYPTNSNINVSSLTATYQQYPSVLMNDISAIHWKLTDPNGTIYTSDPVIRNISYNITGTSSYTSTITNVVVDSNFVLSFVPNLTGNYLVSLSAYINSNAFSKYPGILNNGIYAFTNIPVISASTQQTYVPSITSYSTPVPGFVLETDLYGWNYNIFTYDGKSLGARPIWVKGYTDKSVVTNNKSIESWGSSLSVVDLHNIVSQPIISDIVLNSDIYFEYQNNSNDLSWNQPITLRKRVNTTTWNKILMNSKTTQLSSIVGNSLVLNASALDIPSDIILNNYVNNNLVEIYYNSLGNFVWNITAVKAITNTLTQSDFSLSSAIISYQPYANLSNRNYPSFALIPTLQDLYTEYDSGGYFIPNNLGASVYVGKNYTSIYNTSSIQVSALVEDSKFIVGGRGLSKKDTYTPYNIIKEDNTWMKESILTGNSAGNVDRAISKKYQKFIPYQSDIETHNNGSLGVIKPNSRHSPWGGYQDSVWTDTKNYPINFAGEVNVNSWVETQVLKTTGKQMYNWCSDIFGNQYTLYKNISSVSPIERNEVLGELWIRTNGQTVNAANIALSSIFSPYINSNLYDELTGNGIKNFDIYFDTMIIETSGVLIIETLNYDYSTDKITGQSNKSKYLSLALPLTSNINKELNNTNLNDYDFAKIGEYWFSPIEKQLIVSVVWLSSGVFNVELYSLDINTSNFQKIFPNNFQDASVFMALLGYSNIVDRPLLSYDYVSKEYLLSTIVSNISGFNDLIEVYIKNVYGYPLINIGVYTTTNNEPLPPILGNLELTKTTNILSTTLSSFVFNLYALNTVTNYTLINNTFNFVSLNSTTGVLSGIPTQIGDYMIPVRLTNNYGYTDYNFNVIST